MYCDEHGTLDYCPECSKPSDEEIEHIAEEMSQQDWNDLRFKEVYRKAFIAGAKYFSQWTDASLTACRTKPKA